LQVFALEKRAHSGFGVKPSRHDHRGDARQRPNALGGGSHVLRTNHKL
jgi:hypothetical protein